MAHSHYCVNHKLWLYATMVARKPQDQDKFVLRLPDGMRDRIKFVADQHGRSMNSLIVSVLEETFPPLITASDSQLESALRAARDGLYSSNLSDEQKDELWEKMMGVITEEGL